MPATDEQHPRELQRSASYLARTADMRLTGGSTAECFELYQRLTQVERAAKLARSDVLVELIDQHGLRAIDVSRRTGERRSDLSEMYAVAKTFPRHSRPPDAVYNHLLLAVRVTRRLPGLKWSALQVLDEIRAVGMTQRRAVTRHFARLSQTVAGRVVRLADPAAPILGRAHHGRFQDLLAQFGDASIHVLGLDPPYVYEEEDGLRPYAGGLGRSAPGDANDPALALELVIDALRMSGPKLAPGGVMLVWQPWQCLLRPIMDAAEAYHWKIDGPIIWDKGNAAPGRLDGSCGVQGEMIWMMRRKGDRARPGLPGGTGQMILRCPRSHRPAHPFQKPVALCEQLLQTFSQPGDVVFDACGCTGSLSVAAMRLGRRWAYAESCHANYHLGLTAIEAQERLDSVGQ